MINITYNRKTNTTKVELKNLNAVMPHLPLKVQFKNIITDEIYLDLTDEILEDIKLVLAEVKASESASLLPINSIFWSENDK